MKHRVGSALGLCAVLLTSCRDQQSSPHVATSAETVAILTPLLPHAAAKFRVCVGAQLVSPLDREREDLATNSQIETTKPILQPFWKKLSDILFGPEKHEPAVWYQENAETSLRLQARDAAHLDDLLERASKASLPKTKLSWTIPPEVKACDDNDEKVTEIDPSPVFRFYFSEPVVIANIAFVEEAAVCGGLCGSGSMKALIKRNGRWSVLAVRPTWIS